MADHSWEGWADAEETLTGAPLFSDEDIEDVDFGLRYIWAGTYGGKLNVHFNRIVVPYCGHCTRELSTETCNFNSSCPYCFHECCLGPYVLYADPKKGIKTKSIATDTDGLSSVSGDSAPAPVPAYPHHLSSVRPPTIQSLPTPLKALSISQSQGVGASGDAATKSEDPRVPPRGRESTMRRNPDVVPRPITPRPATPRPATPRPATPKPTIAPKDEDSSTVVPSEYPNSQQPVACLSKPLLSPEAQGFWVAQGRADPKKARTVSRVQRIINARVCDRWGNPMPYAPEWVYDEEWLYGELLKKTDVGPKGLFQSDPQKRQRDMVFLCDTLSEWWYGRTILKHHVKSCGTFQEDRFFSLSSTLPNGGKVEKPHSRPSLCLDLLIHYGWFKYRTLSA
ncbi:hypothetical protein XELAEV_18012264mg [Xenopus laevis]|uniref:Uncharacterized protein n=1 Tax=Xenopus laevis TaxID=8355 RepID=A0A974DP70_XENLA|nr:hypothetical protein XELAEV_18012264mg [Xenopus laevis]